MLIVTICLIILPFPIIAVILSWAGLYRTPVKWEKYFWLFLYPVFIYAYCVEPSYTNDLTRYFEQIALYEGKTLREAFLVQSDGLVTRDLLFWIVSKTGDVHLLPAITTTISYGIGFYITCDSARRLNKESYIFLVMAFEVLVVPFFNVVCNIRNVTAFMIICFAVYREFIQKKRDVITILMYILPCFLHKTGITVLLLRVLEIVFEKYRLLSLALIAGLPPAIEFSHSHISWVRGSGFVFIVLRKLIASSYNYLHDDSEYAASLANSGVGYIRITVYALIIILAYYCYIYLRETKNPDYKRFITFAFELCILTLACGVFDAPAYWRYSVAAYAVCAPVLLTALSNENKAIHMNKFIFCILGAIALMRFAMSLRYTWTRMDFLTFATTTLMTNIYTIFIKLLHVILA